MGDPSAADTAKHRTVSAVRDPDAPASARHESESKLLERAFTSAIAAAKSGQWGLVLAILITAAGALGWRYLDGDDGCSPLVVQHVLHQSAAGEAEAVRLEALGHVEVAAAIRRLTDAEAQPDDVRLCVLMSKKANK